MPLRDFTYVSRKDTEIASRLRMGEYIQVSAPPKTGKTLLAQAVKRSLDEQGLLCSLISLKEIKISNDPSSPGGYITRQIAESFSITKENNTFYEEFINLEERLNRSPGVWLRDFCNEVLLKTLPSDKSIVLIFDDVDGVSNSSLSSRYRQQFIFSFLKQIKDFYLLKGSPIYNKSSFYKRLSVLLTYSYLDFSKYTDLSSDEVNWYLCTLNDFELQDLLVDKEVKKWCNQANPITPKTLEAIYKYTSGHPALTAFMLKAIQSNNPIDSLVENLIKDWRVNILKFLIKSEHILETDENLLRLYKRILDGENIDYLSSENESQERKLQQSLLFSLGMVKEQGGRLIVRNSIFQRISNNWQCIKSIRALETAEPIIDPRHMLAAGIPDEEKIEDPRKSERSEQMTEKKSIEDTNEDLENHTPLSGSESHQNDSSSRNHNSLIITSVILFLIFLNVLSTSVLPSSPFLVRVLISFVSSLIPALAVEFVLSKPGYWNDLVNSLRRLNQKFRRFIGKEYTIAFVSILCFWMMISFLNINYHYWNTKNDLLMRSKNVIEEFIDGESSKHINALQEAIDIHNSAQGIRIFRDPKNHRIPIISLALQYIHFNMDELDRYELPGLEKFFNLAVSADGKVAAGGESRSSSLDVNDFIRDDWMVVWSSSGKVILRDTLGSRLRHVSFSPNGELVAAITEDNRVRLFTVGGELNQKIDASKVRFLARDRTFNSRPRYLTFTTDSQYLAVARSDGKIDIWNIKSDDEISYSHQLSLPYSSSSQEIEKVKLAANSQCLIATANNQLMAWSISGFSEGHDEPSDIINTRYFSPNDLTYYGDWIAIAGQKFSTTESAASRGVVEIRKTLFDGRDCKLGDTTSEQEVSEQFIENIQVIEDIKDAVVSVSMDINHSDERMRLLLMTDKAEVSRYEIPLKRIDMLSQDVEIEPNYSILMNQKLTPIIRFGLRPSSKAEDAYHNFVGFYNGGSDSKSGSISQFITYSPGVKDEETNSSFIQVRSLRNHEEGSQQVVRGGLRQPSAVKSITARRNSPDSQSTAAILYETEISGNSSNSTRLIAFCGNDLQNCGPVSTDNSNVVGLSSFKDCLAVAEKTHSGSTIRFLNWSSPENSNICEEKISLDNNSLIDIKSFSNSSKILMSTSKNIFMFEPGVDLEPRRLRLSNEINSPTSIDFNRIESIDMSSNERYLGIYADGFLRIFENPYHSKAQNTEFVKDVAKQIESIEINQPRDFQFYVPQNQADTFLISLNQDGNKIELWQVMDAPKLSAVLTLEAQTRKVPSIGLKGSWNKVLAYSEGSQTYLVAAGDDEILVWDLSDIRWRRNGFKEPITLEERLVAVFQQDWGGRITSLDVLDGNNDVLAGTESGTLVKLKVRNSSFSSDLLAWGCEWLSEYHAREAAVAPRRRYSLFTTTRKVNKICQKYLALS